MMAGYSPEISVLTMQNANKAAAVPHSDKSLTPMGMPINSAKRGCIKVAAIMAVVSDNKLIVADSTSTRLIESLLVAPTILRIAIPFILERENDVVRLI